jgi:hypothetical protein
MSTSTPPSYTDPVANKTVKEWIITNGVESLIEKYPSFNPLWIEDDERIIYHAALDIEERGGVANSVTICEELDNRKLFKDQGGTIPFEFVSGADHAWVSVELMIHKLHKVWINREMNEIAKAISNGITPEEAQDRLELLSDSWVGEKPYEEFDLEKMDAYKAENDPAGLLGIDGKWRWMMKGGCGLIFGPSGKGKSSLRDDAVVAWALGKSWFGISPRRSMKSLIIQAENDFGDEAEMLQGIAQKHGVSIGDLKEKIVIVSVSGKTGLAFTALLNRLLKKHQVDLVWIDPLFSFAGQDLSLQRPASEFLREFLDPVVKRHGVGAFLIHHTGKPKQQQERDQLDLSNTFFGSVELSAYPRAMIALIERKGGAFELFASKRGKRAGLQTLDGDQVEKIIIKHADEGIGWEQLPGGSEDSEDGENRGKDRLEEYVKFRKRFSPYTKELVRECRERIMQEMSLGERSVKLYEARFKKLHDICNSMKLS